jgi:hypothetical protein
VATARSKDSGPAPRKWSDPAVVALGLALALSAAALRLETRAAEGIDFYHFWVMGRAIPAHGGAGVYSEASLRAIAAEGLAYAEAHPEQPRLRAAARYRSELFNPTATPFLYSLFGRLVTDAYDADFGRYQAVCLAAAAASVLGLCALLGYGLVPALALAVVVLAWYAPLASGLGVGNVGELQLLSLLLFVANQARRASRRRDLAGGAFLGFSVAFKPTFAAVAAALFLAWALERRFATLRDAGLGAAAAGAAAVLASALDHGTLRAWTGWPGVLSFEEGRLARGNYALSQVLLERLGVNAALPIALVAGLAAAAALVQACRGPARAARGDGRRDLLVASIGCQAYLVGGPLIWLHYYVLALPAILVALAPGARGALATLSGAAALALLCLPRLVDLGDVAYTCALALVMTLLGAASVQALRASPR